MTSTHKLLAIVAVCIAVALAAGHFGRHEGCIAFCTSIANAGGN